jgi:hypothetical protein
MGFCGLLLSPAKKPSSDIALSKIILLMIFIRLIDFLEEEPGREKYCATLKMLTL